MGGHRTEKTHTVRGDTTQISLMGVKIGAEKNHILGEEEETPHKLC